MNNFNSNIPKDFNKYKRILVTGGLGFIGGAVIRNILIKSNAHVFNLDKGSYSSDTTSINRLLNKLNPEKKKNKYTLLKVDLGDYNKTNQAIELSNPDLIIHLAAETHVDRSIDNPGDFIQSNIVGTYNLLSATLDHYKKLEKTRKENFLFHHVSTDEVFGSLNKNGYFSESTSYKPRSPYSASKAGSDHLVKAWNHTYGLPTIITNCSNNFGPWQFPEKLIPLSILKAISGNKIPLYGQGTNVRDWIHVEDHAEALLTVAAIGEKGSNYCIGGGEQKTNIEIVEIICNALDNLIPKDFKHKSLITFVEDRPGHDYRYAIDNSLILNELGWKPKRSLKKSLEATVDWYLEEKDWVDNLQKRSGYQGERIGTSTQQSKS